MRLMRATVFAATAVIPSFLLGLFAYWLMGGNLQGSADDFMFIPCYGVPGLCILGVFILGLKEDLGD